MYHRIISAEKLHRSKVGDRWIRYYDVLSEDMREILSSHETFDQAKTELEHIVKLERLSCPTGGCED